MNDKPSLINKQDFPRPLKFFHYNHPILGPVCIDEYCDAGTVDTHCHVPEQQYYGERE